MGYVSYYGNFDFPAAERSFRQALALAPSDAEAHFALAIITRRQGRYDEAGSWFEALLRLNPRDAAFLADFSDHQTGTGRWIEASTLIDRAVKLAPDDLGLVNDRAVLRWSGFGDPAPLRSLHEQHPTQIVEDADWCWYRVHDLLSQDRVREAVSLLDRVNFDFLRIYRWPGMRRPVLRALLARNTGEPTATQDELDSYVAAQKAAYYAEAPPRRTGDLLVTTLAYSGHLDEAGDVLDLVIKEVNARGDRSLYIKRDHDALRLIILALRGEKDAAIEGIRSLMAEPGALTVHELRAVKHYFPTLLDDPRFQALLRGEAG